MWKSWSAKKKKMWSDVRLPKYFHRLIWILWDGSWKEKVRTFLPRLVLEIKRLCFWWHRSNMMKWSTEQSLRCIRLRTEQEAQSGKAIKCCCMDFRQKRILAVFILKIFRWRKYWRMRKHLHFQRARSWSMDRRGLRITWSQKRFTITATVKRDRMWASICAGWIRSTRWKSCSAGNRWNRSGIWQEKVPWSKQTTEHFSSREWNTWHSGYSTRFWEPCFPGRRCGRMHSRLILWMCGSSAHQRWIWSRWCSREPSARSFIICCRDWP